MKTYYCLFLLLIFSSCVHKSDLVHFDEVQKVECSIVCKNAEFGLPLELRYDRDKIFINDFFGDSLIWVYDARKSVVETKIAPKGQSPEEFISPLEISVSDSVIYIFERSAFTMNKLKYTSNFKKVKERKKIRMPARINDLAVISDKMYIASGAFGAKRFAVIDSVGEIVAQFGTFPDFWSEEKNIPNEAKAMFHQNRFIVNKAKQLFASVSSNVVEIYDYSTKDIKMKCRVLLSPYEYTYSTGNLLSANRKDNIERGAIDVNCTEDHIYVVYNPNTKELDKDSTRKRLNNEIWVFDWEGKPIKLLRPNLNVTNICIDSQDKKAFCIVESPNPLLAMMDL